MKKRLVVGLGIGVVLFSPMSHGDGLQIISKPDITILQPKSNTGTFEENDKSETTQEIIKRLEAEVRPIPASDRKGNLLIYKKLLVIAPDNPQYKRKVIYYSKPLERKNTETKKTYTQTNKIKTNDLFAMSAWNYAKNDLKQSLMRKYEDSYSTIEILLNAGMRDYKTLCSIEDHKVNNANLARLKDKFYPSFSAILLLYNSNVKSHNRLLDN